MAKSVEYIIRTSVSKILKEAPELDNAPSDGENSMFTPAEKKFLGKFDARGTNHIGMIYSTSDAGITEFLMRTGKDLNLTREMLDKFIEDDIIEITPYGGYGTDTNYTLQLNLSLDDINGFGDADKEELESGSASAGGAPAPESDTMAPPETEPAPAPTNDSVIKYGDIISESIKIVSTLLTEKTKSKKKDTKTKSTVHVKQSRELNLLPKGFILQLERIIDMINMKAKTKFTKQRLIADILDNLAINLDLTTDQIHKSYIYHKNQKKLNSILNKK